MASDYYVFENSFYADPFSPFTDSTSMDSSHHEILQSFEDYVNGNIQENSADGVVSNSLHQIACGLLPSSPPSHQLENISLTHVATPQNFLNANNSLEFSGLGAVKSEGLQITFGSENCNFNNLFYGNAVDNAMRLMQRSYSSNSLEGRQPNFCFQPSFERILESPNLQPQALCGSPESKFQSYHMRRVSSTGDIQRMKTMETRNVLSSSPLSAEGSFLEEPNSKVGRYTAEERKERIHRYRAKRTLRNFNKTIKYACRKTLADNRPRIRGRFARNDEAVEIPKAAMFNGHEEEDDLWVDRYNEEEEEGTVGKGPFYNSYGSAGTLYQYYSY